MQLSFDEWFAQRFPSVGDNPEAFRLALREIALDAWNASRDNMTWMDL
jgi:hypothetical protein